MAILALLFFSEDTATIAWREGGGREEGREGREGERGREEGREKRRDRESTVSKEGRSEGE